MRVKRSRTTSDLDNLRLRASASICAIERCRQSDSQRFHRLIVLRNCADAQDAGLGVAFECAIRAKPMTAFASAPSDTIFALSSGRPPAAIAVVRISGPRAASRCEALIGRVPEPRKATLARVRDPATGRGHRRGAGALVSGSAQRDRRGRRRAAAPWRPRRHRRGAGGARPARRLAAGGAGRVHPPRVREGPPRPDPGRGAGRPGLCRDRGAAPAGASSSCAACWATAPRPGARGRSRRWRRSRRPSISPTKATCRRI